MTSADFVERVAEWQSFYAVLAGASATFAGLLFVSLSVNPRILAREHEAAYGTLMLVAVALSLGIPMALYALVTVMI